jgi:PAS domain S-box-containing protein
MLSRHAADGEILYVSPASRAILGYEPHELVGRKMVEILHRETAGMLIATQGRVPDHDRPVTAMLRLVRKDGADAWVETTGLRIDVHGEKSPQIISLSRDVTEQRAAEAASREIEERTRELNQELAEANRRKDEFLAVLAHELRNPLAPIVNAVDAVTRTGVNDPTIAKALTLVGEKARHLVRLVDDLLDVSRITRGIIHIQREPIDLVDVVRQAATTSRPSLEEQRHHFAIQLDGGPLRVRGDIVRLVQVLANLLNNAAKFTPRGGTIVLAASADDHHVTISVRDDGIGIDAENLRRVFDLFFQMHRPPGAMGIGLALVRSIVELHGGHVEARSAGLGAGSEFLVTLPRLVEEEAVPLDPPATAFAPAVRAHRVLVVDDDHAVAEGFAMLLDSLGQQVAIAHDGASALVLVTQFDPDLVFIDLSMPGMDGYETARRMRRLSGAGDRRVIALSGYGLATVESRLRQAGFDQYLAKPAAVEELESILA